MDEFGGGVGELTGIAAVDEASARQAARRLRSDGARNVIVITLGAKGALLAGAQGEILIAAALVEAIDSTAAGDAFNGGLAWALSRGLGIEEAVRQSSLVAALSTTRIGAQPSMPMWRELEQFSACVDDAL